ncbi:HPP family protein [Novosphingobium sp. TH158]|uniref:HPP family protein n=1 Tax=Novosphingobium sp. TH158 TaxID=2067455 RepID=UPI000C7C4CBA|nr:HPP family protein [Novosphingobium sp. TH158]PLK27239.1 HPP family protein [Novosphingobium sp. TH158]
MQTSTPHFVAATPQTMPAVGHSGWLPGALGAMLAIALTGWASHLILPSNPTLPWLIAPMGASAVLVFLLPASPLSQPWPVVGGHLLAALTGLACHALVPLPWLAAALAVGLSVAVMSMARCLHAPAGGTALLPVLASPAVSTMNANYLLLPLVLNVILMVVCGWGWHQLSGHSWPHRPVPAPIPAAWVGHIEDADLDAVLEEWDEVLDVSREDLLALLHAVETRVRARALS